jgi:hypothetical protein
VATQLILLAIVSTLIATPSVFALTSFASDVTALSLSGALVHEKNVIAANGSMDRRFLFIWFLLKLIIQQQLDVDHFL